MIMDSTGLIEAVCGCWKYWKIYLPVGEEDTVRNTEDLDNRK